MIVINKSMSRCVDKNQRAQPFIKGNTQVEKEQSNGGRKGKEG